MYSFVLFKRIFPAYLQGNYDQAQRLWDYIQTNVSKMNRFNFNFMNHLCNHLAIKLQFPINDLMDYVSWIRLNIVNVYILQYTK